MIVYAVENVCEVGLGINAVQFGRFDQRHGACQGFRPGVVTRTGPIFPSNSPCAHRPLSGIVVNGDTTIRKEQAKRRPAAQTIAKGFRQIAFAGDARQLLFGPVFERRDFRFAQFLTCRKACVSSLTCDLTLNVLEFSNPVEGLTSDL